MSPDKPADSPPTLTDKIQELEQLIPDREGSTSRSVPVLDDLVQAGDADTTVPDIDRLEQRLQQRLDAELAELAGVLKGVIKRCITEELNSYSHSTQRDPENSRDTSGKPDAH